MKPRHAILAAILATAAGSAAHAQAPINITQTGLGAGAVYNVEWLPDPACPACGTFDVISGDLFLLRAGGGAFGPTVLACQINNAAASPFTPLAPIPGPGAGIYVLVRAQTAPLPPAACGTWDMEFPGAAQPVSRGPGIAASPLTCACP